MNNSLMDNSLKQDRCPLCKSNKISPIGKLNYREKINFSTHEIRLKNIPEIWKCKRCRSAFVQNTLDSDTAKELYATGQENERWLSVAFNQSKTSNVVDTMTDLLINKNVLDVGCNTGELLDFAKSKGCKTFGVELSVVSRKILHEKGHVAYSSLSEAPGEYDVITAFDLVEHLYDIPAFLRICREKLTEKGKLVILTGNIGSLSAKFAGLSWWYTQYPEHIVFPSKKFLSNYSGLRIDRFVSTYASKDYKVPIFRACLTVLKDILRGRTYNGLPALGGDHFLVVLSK